MEARLRRKETVLEIDDEFDEIDENEIWERVQEWVDSQLEIDYETEVEV